MSNILVAYFSATGNTHRVAKLFSRFLESDLYEIKPKIPYTEEDLYWRDRNNRTSHEMKDVNCRPEIENKLDSIKDYDIVFLGYPIWWYMEPRIIDTFLESYDFSGKRIVLFATSNGCDLGTSVNRIGELAPGAEVIHGKRFNKESTKHFIAQWIDGFYTELMRKDSVKNKHNRPPSRPSK